MTALIDRRRFLTALPALAVAPRVLAQADGPPVRVRGLSQMTLTVSDVQRSLAFYQGLFGMPIQARQGSSVFLRVGSGPQFLALRPAAAGESPSISAFGMGVEDFDANRVMTTLLARGVSRAQSAAAGSAPAAMTARLTSRLPAGGNAGESTQELFVTDPSGIVFQLHDVAYCGGGGARGNVCRAPERAPRGRFAVRDISHFTINVTDQERTVAFYQSLFGFEVQVRQGAAPAYGVGSGVQFLMFAGGAPGGRAGAPREGGPAAGARGEGGGRAATPPGPGVPAGGGPPRASRIDHACLSMEGFKPDVVTKTLVGYGLKEQQAASREPRVTYISLRMPNRGGAEGGTPELYLTDPDGLAIQLQDVSYCGGGGFLGDLCPPL